MRSGAGGARLHLCGGRLQFGVPAAASGDRAVSGPLDCQVIGRWRIVESDMWDRDYLDLVEPASITIDRGGRGELAFGVVNASLDLEYSQTVVFFTFEGSDEGDEVNGSGSAELLDDGTLEIEIAFHLGDEAVLRAKREGSSTPC